ncbi:MAG TPA: GyrI-like domain-containing protein [Candidatus Aminicenantes bacterium]|nr:GyrI-like domain-containing protein [Candidatus Aminicenantes bacterium]HRY63814.1 GyrI-like domain-containing protein [Candidatus Aminicenantes bacterium]HRZ70727.1 GyrI-like domain-containing protein [Candidatus Aminicenantes bacterium]
MPSIDRRGLLRTEYMARINRVIDHIERNIGRDLSLDELARAANFSPFHFHRIFAAVVGEPLHAFVLRIRAERAAGALLSDPKATITAIALDHGYSSSAAFARAFRDRFGMSASEWRRGGGRPAPRAGASKSKKGQTVRKIRKAPGRAFGYPAGERSRFPRRMPMSNVKIDVEVKDLPALEVSYVRHIGPFQGVAGAFEKLMRWAGPRGLIRFPETKLLAVYHDNPDITEADKLRSSACITVPAETKADGEIGRMSIPGGRFAVARAEILPHQFGEAWNALMGDWFPESGYQPDDRMCYEVYLNDPKSHPEGKFLIEICEPVRPL